MLQQLLVVMMMMALAGPTPTYLPSVNTDHSQLRSVTERICVVPRAHNSCGDRSFSAAGPRVWNALPSYLRYDVNYTHFKQALRRHVYAVVDHGAL